jgi:hypothetical protein
LVFADHGTQGDGIQRIVVARQPVQAKNGTDQLGTGQAQQGAAVTGVDLLERVHEATFDGAKVQAARTPPHIGPDQAGEQADGTGDRLTDRPTNA